MNVKRSEKKLGTILLDDGLITDEQLQKALEEHQKTSEQVGECLVRLNFVTPDKVTAALGKQYGMPYITLSEYEIELSVIKALEEEVARKYKVIPVDKSNSTLTVALSDPTNIHLLDDLKLKTKMNIVPLISLESEINKAIDKYYGKNDEDSLNTFLEDINKQEVDADIVDINVEEDSDSGLDAAPVIKLVNLIVSEAIKVGASDIHIEPEEKKIRVRYRIDGVLHEMPPPPKRLQNAISSRLKIMSELDISERRLPQDGRFKMRSGNKVVDFRVSILPTVFGEKIVMRLLDKSNLMLDMERLGFEPESLDFFYKAINSPFGMILVTGPTGSGKSTTLYSALSKLNDPEENIITVEDPVEFQIEGINQVQAKADIGLTFAEGLRSILRQDPDIVMIGEIRDLETADMAVKAALTGHLVLSTLHTNDAPSAISRLNNMGIEPYNITASLILVVAQRLARRICANCKKPYKPSAELLKSLGLQNRVKPDTMFYEGAGCEICNGLGYKGRLALYEVMSVTDELRDAIIKGAISTELKRIARRNGMITLRESGLRKILDGKTTVKEVLSNSVADEPLD